jgi:hypothetical protein
MTADEARRAEAAQALAEIDEGRAAADRAARAPWWYYPVEGVLFGGLLTLSASRQVMIATVVSIGVVVGSLVLNEAYRLATGVRANLFTGGGIAIGWTIGWFAALAAALCGAWAISLLPAPLIPALALGVLMAGLTVGYGAFIERARRPR